MVAIPEGPQVAGHSTISLSVPQLVEWCVSSKSAYPVSTTYPTIASFSSVEEVKLTSLLTLSRDVEAQLSY